MRDTTTSQKAPSIWDAALTAWSPGPHRERYAIQLSPRQVVVLYALACRLLQIPARSELHEVIRQGRSALGPAAVLLEVAGGRPDVVHLLQVLLPDSPPVTLSLYAESLLYATALCQEAALGLTGDPEAMALLPILRPLLPAALQDLLQVLSLRFFRYATPGRRCLGCGCTDEAACAGGCYWDEGAQVHGDLRQMLLCSQCVRLLLRIQREAPALSAPELLAAAQARLRGPGAPLEESEPADRGV